MVSVKRVLWWIRSAADCYCRKQSEQVLPSLSLKIRLRQATRLSSPKSYGATGFRLRRLWRDKFRLRDPSPPNPTPRTPDARPRTACRAVGLRRAQSSRLAKAGRRGRGASRINMESKGKLNLVSVGPGFAALVPAMAETALRESDVIIGYKLYFTWIQPLIEGKEVHSFSLTEERERAQTAIACARAGRTVSLVSSGDIGIYGMAPLVLEEMREEEEFQLQIIPGVSAANSSAALLGSPLGHDFATLSLSDLLCPWEWIENRARHLAKAGLVTALYNVQSQSRPDGVYRILRILLEEKSANTWCGVVRNAFRPDQTVYLCSLAELQERQFDMLTTIIVGNRFTRKKGRFIYTPRGYHGWTLANEREPSPAAAGSESARLRPVVRNSGRLRLASLERVGTSPAVEIEDGQSAAPATDDTPNRQRPTANRQRPTANRQLPTANRQPLTANQQPIWVFSGTGDGNALAAELSRVGYRLIVSTASDYGAELASMALPGFVLRSC